MIDLNKKYSIFEKIFDWPKSKELILCRESYKKDPKSIKTLDQFLLNNAILYFWTKYIDKAKDILWLENNYNSDEIYADEMIEIISNTKNKINSISIIKLREYQEAAINFLNKNRWSNNLVIMPTGYWKTIIAFKEIEEQLKLGKKIVFSAPTNNLVQQQFDDFIDYARYTMQDEDLITKSSFWIKEDMLIYFVTNHKLEIWLRDLVFDENFFYIIDEVHEWEWKLWEEKDHKYPTFKSFENLSHTNYKSLTLSATPINIPILKEKLWIENIFIWSLKQYFVEKRREIKFIKPDKNFEEILILINIALNLETEYIMYYLNSKKEENEYSINELKELKKYSKSKLIIKNYFDAWNIKKLENIFPKDIDSSLYDSLWMYKKILEIKKRHYQNEYHTMSQYIYEEIWWEIEIKIWEVFAERYQLIKSKKEENNSIKLDKITKKIEKLDVKLKKLYKEKYVKKYVLSKSKPIHRLLSNINEISLDCVWKKTDHPKVHTLFELLDFLRYNNKTVVVHVENENIITELVNKALNLWIKASYLKWWAKNKKQKFIDNYTKENIKNNNLDVVFVTTVFKLWVNFDIENLIFYHPPKNIKDLLQFEWRIWRYSKIANIYYLAIEWWFELWKILRDIKNAKKYLSMQFEEAEKAKQEYLF